MLSNQLEKTLESSLGSKENKLVNQEINPEYTIIGSDAKRLKLQYFYNDAESQPLKASGGGKIGGCIYKDGRRWDFVRWHNQLNLHDFG